MVTNTTALIGLAGIFLAFSNGANDNFKGVATLFGSRTASYKTVLTWATVTTLAGSVAAFFFAQKLLVSFSGKGLVPEAIVGTPSFAAAVAMAGACTVFLATRFGFPISTTHALTGALVGAGLFADPAGVNGGRLFSAFLFPLLISPVLSIIGAVTIYPVLSALKKRLGVSRESCLCIGNEVLVMAPSGVPKGSSAAVLQMSCAPQISIGTKVSCEERYLGEVWGISAKKMLDTSHFISAGLVSFARGLNDTPKIAAIILVGGLLPAMPAVLLAAVTIALGGILMSRRIAQTMSSEITEMNDGQGFSANLVTSAIVIGASQLGMPVSTTHVSCGALFGIGTINGKAHWGSILKIFMAWVVTLPVAGVLGYAGFWILKGLI